MQTRRFRMTVAYLGTHFRGWQRQDNARSVQAEIERAAAGVFEGLSITVEGASRTDAGVHATGQLIHCDLPVGIPASNLAKAMNHHLDPEVRVLSAIPAVAEFHARKPTRAKRYVYRIRWDHAPVLPPWQTLRTATVRPPRRPETVVDLVSLFEGARNWAPFTVASPSTRTTHRTVFSAATRAGTNGIRLEFVGDGFLRYQIRRMVGALLQVGWGQFNRSWLEGLLQSDSHAPDVYTAPAKGLTLEKVFLRAPERPARGGESTLTALVD